MEEPEDYEIQPRSMSRHRKTLIDEMEDDEANRIPMRKSKMKAPLPSLPIGST